MNAPLYVVEREYPVSRERLWRAWTDPADVEQWYSPTDLSVVPGSVVSDPVPGGAWTVAVDAEPYGFIAYFFGRYTEVDPLNRFVHTLHYTQDVTEFEARDESTEFHLIVLELEDAPGGSLARFTQIGEMPEEQVELTREGTTLYFESLHRYLVQR